MDLLSDQQLSANGKRLCVNYAIKIAPVLPLSHHQITGSGHHFDIDPILAYYWQTSEKRGTKLAGRPGKDLKATPVSGASRDGQPLPLSRAPDFDLLPWISRMFITEVSVPDNHVINCGIFNDICYVRVLLHGEWMALTVDGPTRHDAGVLFFGPQSRRMPVSVRGPFRMVGFGFRPGACHALFGHDAHAMMDRIFAFEEVGGPCEMAAAVSAPGLSNADTLTILENRMRSLITVRGAQRPDAITTAFDRAAFADPGIKVSHFANEHLIDQRRLQRLIKRDFGTNPKQVLRRARILDMASQLRGVADDAESDALRHRYFDQSHLIREFHSFMGQTPAQFAVQPQPVMTLTLEVRQARRLEELGILSIGAHRPWEA